MFLNEKSLFDPKKMQLKRKKEQAKKDIDKAIEIFKKKHKEGKLLPNDFKQIVNALYRIPTENIVEEVPTVFRIIRMGLFIGIPTIINPAFGLLAWLTDRVIEEKVNEKYGDSALRQYNKQLENVKEDLKDPNIESDKKDKLKTLKRELEADISKLERYYGDLKTYKDENPLGDRVEAHLDNKDSDDDFGDLNFGESANLNYNGGESMIYSDDNYDYEMDKKMIKAFNESLDETIALGLEYGCYDNIIQESKVRHAVKQGYAKLDRSNRRSSDKIDSVGDILIDGRKITEVKKIREEIMRGRIKVSTVIKGAITAIAGGAALGTSAGPYILLGAIAYLARRGYIKKKQKDEMLSDLKAELEILTEKIKDAESDNDKKKKYEYIRLKREVQKSIDKLRYGNRISDIDRTTTF